jgi:hypothetical protein
MNPLDFPTRRRPRSRTRSRASRPEMTPRSSLAASSRTASGPSAPRPSAVDWRPSIAASLFATYHTPCAIAHCRLRHHHYHRHGATEGLGEQGCLAGIRGVQPTPQIPAFRTVAHTARGNLARLRCRLSTCGQCESKRAARPGIASGRNA